MLFVSLAKMVRAFDSKDTEAIEEKSRPVKVTLSLSPFFKLQSAVMAPGAEGVAFVCNSHSLVSTPVPIVKIRGADVFWSRVNRAEVSFRKIGRAHV